MTTPSPTETLPPPPSTNDPAALFGIVGTYDQLNSAIDAAQAAAPRLGATYSEAYSEAYNAAAAAVAAQSGPYPDSAGDAPAQTAAVISGPCPDTIQIPITKEQVRWFADPITCKMKYDTKTSPIPLPHPDLQFKGYVVDGPNVSVLFKSPSAAGKKGTRFPRKPSGGVNKRWFQELNACTTTEEKERYKRQHWSEYVPRSARGSGDRSE